MNLLKSFIAVLLTSILFLCGCTSSNKEESKHSIIIGTELEYPPFSYLKDRHIEGFDIDVITEACARADLKYILKPIPHFDALIPELIIGKIDVIAAGISPTKEREKKVLFTTLHHQGKSFIVIANSEIPLISNLKDLSGYTVAVNEGYTTETELEKISGVAMLRLGTPAEALLALKAQHVDAFLISYAAAQPLLKSNVAAGYSIFKIEETAENIAFALNKENTELLEKLNNVLEEMKIDGTLKQIEAKWGL
jgi:polar amino acid transport system substrate-binding protein